MKSTFSTDSVSQPSHGFFTRTPGVHIAPRTLAKMRDANYLMLARMRFLNDLPYQTPNEAVEAGARTVTDWCMCLAEARSEVGRTDFYEN
jgi:hypothetical protein